MTLGDSCGYCFHRCGAWDGATQCAAKTVVCTGLGRPALRRPSGFAYGGSIAALKLGLMHLPQRGQETLHTIAGSAPALARKASWRLLGASLPDLPQVASLVDSGAIYFRDFGLTPLSDSLSSPDGKSHTVTTDRTAHEYSTSTVEFFSPGSPAFPEAASHLVGNPNGSAPPPRDISTILTNAAGRFVTSRIRK